MGRTWSSTQACEIAGCTYRQLDYWMRTGVFVNTAQGSGSRRRLTDRDVEALAACTRAAQLLSSTAAYKVIADAVLASPIEPGDQILVDGHDVRRWAPGQPLGSGDSIVVLIPLRTIDTLVPAEFADPSGSGSTAAPECAAPAPPGSAHATAVRPVAAAVPS